MNNPRIFEVQFVVTFGENHCALHALIKPTEIAEKFHVLRVQSLNTKENASVINDFFILKITKDNNAFWAHADSGISSIIVQAIGNAVEQHTNC